MNIGTLMLIMLSTTKAFNLPAGLLAGICKVESNYNVNAMHYDDGNGTSIGVCQIKLSTARQYGYKGSERHLKDPTVNVFYAGKFLRHQLDRYSGDYHKAISAYNAGSYRKFNHKYVKKVLKTWKEASF